jgi:hypothetical protein
MSREAPIPQLEAAAKRPKVFMPRLSTGAGCVLPLLLFCAHGAVLEPKSVSSVEMFGGESSVPFETKTGQPLDRVKLRNDVRTLWRSGRFSDIRAESVEDGDSVRVVFRVQPKYSVRVRKVEVKPPTPGIDIQLPAESEIDPLGAQQIGASVRKQLEGSGFPFVKVEANLIPVSTGHADLEVKIDQGKRIDIDRVTLTGDLGAHGGGARKVLKWTSSKTMLPGIPGIWKGWHILPGYSESAVQYDAANLRSFFYTRGYFDVDVKPEPVDLTTGKARLEYKVQSGPRFAIRQFNLIGTSGDRSIPIASGDAFPMREACNALFDERRKAEQAGILDFTAKIEVRDVPDAPSSAGAGPRKWADLTATIERGPAYRIGRIEFRGNHSFSDRTIRRTLLLDEGEPLDEMLLRKSLSRLNSTGLFEELSQSNVVVNTPPGSNKADLTIQLRERKMRHWYLSGPAGPLSVGGPLQFAIGSRLPPWGRQILELSTYTVSMNLMLFAKPLGSILPGFPDKRFVPALLIQRPSLPGQRLFSGFVISPQMGWKGMLTGYGLSQARGLVGGLFESPRAYTPALAVTISHAGPSGSDVREGTLYCEPEKTKLDWVRQISGIATKLMFSFSPF